jgi:hypothetical protein
VKSNNAEQLVVFLVICAIVIAVAVAVLGSIKVPGSGEYTDSQKAEIQALDDYDAYVKENPNGFWR